MKKRGMWGSCFAFLLSSLWIAFPLLSFETQKPGCSSHRFQDFLSFYKNIEDKSFASPGALPLFRRDKNGRNWAVWEESTLLQSQIRLSEIRENGEAYFPKIISPAGFNFSADLAFDRKGSPWLVWVNDLDGLYRMIVQEVDSGRAWTMNSIPGTTVCSPKIVFDRNNFAWIFWSGSCKGKEGIFWRVFNQNFWSSPRMIETGNPFPEINPSAAEDENGLIWLAWSGYDGDDYEIFLASWNGVNWSEKLELTDNEETDSFPELLLTPDGNPVVAWAQSSKSGIHICLKSRENLFWSEEVRIAALQSQTPFFRTVTDGKDAAIVWRSGDRIRIDQIDRRELRPKKDFVSAPPSFCFLLNPSLKENQYIGFGDSITYGYINHEPYPRLGYIPRLESILDQNFGPTDIINEGNPGEVTQNGLARMSNVLSEYFARYILIMEGFNDIIFYDISVETTAFNLKEMAKKCLSAGLFPAIATITPRRDDIWYTYPFVRERLLSLNQKIRQIAAELSIPLVDQFAAFNSYPSSDGGLLSLLSEDLKHPSKKGYQVMAEKWFEEIKNFPFPPVNLQLKRRDFFWNSKFTRVQGASSFLFFQPSNSPEEGRGYLISWQASPKIFDKTRIKGYKIYRKKKSQLDSAFQLLALVSDGLIYFDKDVTSEYYSYLISTLRTDEVEGPATGPVSQ